MEKKKIGEEAQKKDHILIDQFQRRCTWTETRRSVNIIVIQILQQINDSRQSRVTLTKA